MNLSKLFKRKKKTSYHKFNVELNNGIREEVLIDKKQKHIALAKTSDKRIYVNKEFLNKTKKQQKAIVYHERGHSKFILFRLSYQIADIFCILFLLSLIISALTFIFFSIVYLLGVFYTQLIINWNYLFYGVATLFISFTNLLIYSFINWLIEIIADFNSKKNVGIENFKNSIITYYQEKEFNLWNDWIKHPPWKLREKIMEGLD